MPRIRFTATPKLPRDLAHLGYAAGTEVDLSEDQAGRWLRRGVAVVIPPPPPVAPSPAAAPPAAAQPAEPPVEIPADWQNQHHMVRMALARRLTADPLDNVAAADAAIAAELARRAGLGIQMAV